MASKGEKLQTFGQHFSLEITDVKHGDLMPALSQHSAERGERIDMARDGRANKTKVGH